MARAVEKRQRKNLKGEGSHGAATAKWEGMFVLGRRICPEVREVRERKRKGGKGDWPFILKDSGFTY